MHRPRQRKHNLSQETVPPEQDLEGRQDGSLLHEFPHPRGRVHNIVRTRQARRILQSGNSQYGFGNWQCVVLQAFQGLWERVSLDQQVQVSSLTVHYIITLVTAHIPGAKFLDCGGSEWFPRQQYFRGCRFNKAPSGKQPEGDRRFRRFALLGQRPIRSTGALPPRTQETRRSINPSICFGRAALQHRGRNRHRRKPDAIPAPR